MALKLVTPPTIQPVTLAEAKAHCRVETSDDDVLITSLIEAATSYLDGYTGILGRCLIEQTWALYYDAFPSGDLQIPLGPLISVTSVEYVDATTGLFVTWAGANYEVDIYSADGWIIPVNGWQSPIMDTSNAIRVTFKAGYGATAASVPEAIRAWIFGAVTLLYDDRLADLGTFAPRTLAPFRKFNL